MNLSITNDKLIILSRIVQDDVFHSKMLQLIAWILSFTIYDAIIFWFLIFVGFLLIRFYTEQIQIENLKQKSIYITGCDRGFGRDLTIRCLENGMPVFAGCVTSQGIESLKNEKKQRNLKGDLDAFLLDVTNEKSVMEIGQKIGEKVQKFGGLHAIVNNAGITGKSVPDDFLTLDEYYKVANVNLWGVIATTKSVLKYIKQARGRVITAASICARVGLDGLGPYTVSKYGVSGYCDVLRNEMKHFGVSVHILEPGFFNTPLVNRQKIDQEIQEAWNEASKEVKEEYGEAFFEQCRKNRQNLLNLVSSDKIYWVIDAYFHAITAKYPRCRYQVGWDSILLFIPFSFLPTGIQDFFFSIFLYFVAPKPANRK